MLGGLLATNSKGAEMSADEFEPYVEKFRDSLAEKDRRQDRVEARLNDIQEKFRPTMEFLDKLCERLQQTAEESGRLFDIRPKFGTGMGLVIVKNSSASVILQSTAMKALT